LLIALYNTDYGVLITIATKVYIIINQNEETHDIMRRKARRVNTTNFIAVTIKIQQHFPVKKTTKINEICQ